MFWLKQIVGALATPLVIASLITISALLCRLLGRRRLSIWLLASALAIGYLGSISPVGEALLRPLENRYPAVLSSANFATGYVLVLGSGYAPRSDIPVTAALDEDGLVRIVEGIRLMRVLRAPRLIVSGGAPRGRASAASGYAELARSLGVGDESLIVLDDALDTGAEARTIVELLRDTPFVLVTSAYHMPRSMLLMERAGARAIPAPAGHLIGSGGWSWRSLLPDSTGLRKTERALHEYLGLLALQVSAAGWPQSAPETTRSMGPAPVQPDALHRHSQSNPPNFDARFSLENAAPDREAGSVTRVQ